MKNIRLGRSLCGHLATAESREWLITNGIGGYGCGTVAGHLTRHYHGTLVAALNPPLGRTLLLAKLEENVQYLGKAVPLYTNRWSDGTVDPKGYQHIETFQLDGAIPHWTFALGDALLSKRVWMQQGKNTTYTLYSLDRGSGAMALTIKAVVNYRNHHGGTIDRAWHVSEVPRGVQVNAFPEAVPFYILSDRGPVSIQQHRFDQVHLAVEQYRGTGQTDTYWQVATIQATLQPGESLTVVASTESAPNLDGNDALGDRHGYETALLQNWEALQASTSPNAPSATFSTTPSQAHQPPQSSNWIQQLVLAADQFIVDRTIAADSSPAGNNGDTMGKSVIAGYPWFSDWGRDTMISLPGLAIATGRPHLARPILQVFGQYLDQGMLPNVFPESGQTPHYNTVDAILWYFEAIRAYVDATQDYALLQELFPALADVIQWHCRGTRYSIQVDTNDGLLYAGEAGVQLTWMDAKIGDWVVTPRIGKPVEINALWYNALGCMVQFAHILGQPDGEYIRLAEQCAVGFQRFWYEEGGYCFDVLDTPDGTHDTALRPNQIFAVALPYGRSDTWQQRTPLLSRDRQKSVVDTVARELYTSHGLRSLSPHHSDYAGHYGGNPQQRDAVYHQGTVWSWLIGPFVQAHWQVYHNSDQAYAWLNAMGDHLLDAGLGSVSEIFDGDAPFQPRGCFAQAWGVAEILRVWGVLNIDQVES
ncbi:MAG: glycogen debranching protein [Merismopedia sp. SIO2A8]|nr:glycogen debranching protein [Merismopedia sp. SIO2A8]